MKKLLSIILSFAMLFSVTAGTTTIEAASKNKVKTSITQVESKAKGFKVSWKKKSKIKGYQIQYSTSKKFKKSSTKIKNVNNAKTTSKTIKNLKGCGKTYYVRLRTYKVSKGKKLYSSWSKLKKVITLKHKYSRGKCIYCSSKKSNGGITKIRLNKTVTVSTKQEDYTGKLKLTVLGFEKTSWKADEYRLNEDDLDDMAPEFKALGKTEEIGMLKLVVTRVSYNDEYGYFDECVNLRDFIKTYDKYGVALNAINTGWDYGSFEVALAEIVEMEIGETTRVAIPYIYDTSNSTLKVVLGNKYELKVPIVQ